MRIISRLEIEGFKSCNSKVVVNFYYPITLILGQNGVGKSTILEAITYLFNPAKRSSIPFFAREGFKASELNIALFTTDSEGNNPKSLLLHQTSTPRGSYYLYRDGKAQQEHPLDIDENFKKGLLTQVLGVENFRRAKYFAFPTFSDDFMRSDEKSYFSIFNEIFKNEKVEKIIKNMKTSLPSKNVDMLDQVQNQFYQNFEKLRNFSEKYSTNKKLIEADTLKLDQLIAEFNELTRQLYSIKDASELSNFTSEMLLNLSNSEKSIYESIPSNTPAAEVSESLKRLTTRYDGLLNEETEISEKLKNFEFLQKNNSTNKESEILSKSQENVIFITKGKEICSILAKLGFPLESTINEKNFENFDFHKIISKIIYQIDQNEAICMRRIAELEKLLKVDFEILENFPQKNQIIFRINAGKSKLEEYSSIDACAIPDNELEDLNVEVKILSDQIQKINQLRICRDSLNKELPGMFDFRSFVVNIQSIYESNLLKEKSTNKELEKVRKIVFERNQIVMNYRTQLKEIDREIQQFGVNSVENEEKLNEEKNSLLQETHVLEGKKSLSVQLSHHLSHHKMCPICFTKLSQENLRNALNNLELSKIDQSIGSCMKQIQQLNNQIKFLEILKKKEIFVKKIDETSKQIQEADEQIIKLKSDLFNSREIVKFCEKFKNLEFIENFEEIPEKLSKLQKRLDQHKKHTILKALEDDTELLKQIDRSEKILQFREEMKISQEKISKLREDKSDVEQLKTCISDIDFAYSSYIAACNALEEIEKNEQETQEKISQLNSKLREIHTFKSQYFDNKNAYNAYIRIAEKKENLGAGAAEKFNQLKIDSEQLQEKMEALSSTIQTLTKENDSLSGSISEIKTRSRELENNLIAQIGIRRFINELNSIISTTEKVISPESHQDKIAKFQANLNTTWSNLYKQGDLKALTVDCISKDTKKSENLIYFLSKTNGNHKEMISPKCNNISDGQRALISFAVRKTFIEVFTSCGVIALDEPTANLDRNKINNLTQSLTAMLSADSLSMQLVIISHDDSFLDLLRSSGYPPECYLRISKDPENPAETRCESVPFLGTF